jgi:hypothetical protein
LDAPHIEPASFANIRDAVAGARAGVSTRLEGNVGMNVKEAQEFARSLVGDDGSIVVDIDGVWLLIAPADAQAD